MCCVEVDGVEAGRAAAIASLTRIICAKTSNEGTNFYLREIAKIVLASNIQHKRPTPAYKEHMTSDHNCIIIVDIQLAY